MKTLIPLILFLLFFPLQAHAWYSDWGYRKAVTITGQAGAGTNFQVKLLVGATSSASGENFDLEGHSTDFPAAKGDGGDLIFTDNDGSTTIDFWVESVTGSGATALATIWVEVGDSLESNADIYCYYGKTGASNASNGANTFLVFDDFDGGSLDGTKWTQQNQTGGSTSFANSQITFTVTGASIWVWIHSNSTIAYPAWVEAQVDTSDNTLRMGESTGTTLKANGNYYLNYSCDVYPSPGAGRIVGDDATTGWAVANGTFTTDGLWQFTWAANSVQRFDIDYTNKLNGTHATNAIADYYFYIGYASSAAGSAVIDYVRARKYLATPPAYNTAAAEETPPVAGGTGILFQNVGLKNLQPEWGS